MKSRPPSVILVVGPFPPPMHGAALVTEEIAKALVSHAHVIRCSISPGQLQRTPSYHLSRIFRNFVALGRIIKRVTAGRRCVYISAAGGVGKIYNILICMTARMLGYRIVVHHHSFAYIQRSSKLFAVLARMAGGRAIHIMLCETMEQRLRSRYQGIRQTLILSNAAFLPPHKTRRARTSKTLRLGHLSNLGAEKGLGEVFETTRRLVSAGSKVKLILAGPPTTRRDAETIEAAKAEFGDVLDYRGPVYGDHKETFYGDIDVFLFPTRYVNEAQPNVILEAMSFGVPSISYARGCIAGDLANGGGISIDSAADYVEECLPILKKWGNDKELLLAAKKKALKRAAELRATADKQFEHFISVITG